MILQVIINKFKQFIGVISSYLVKSFNLNQSMPLKKSIPEDKQDASSTIHEIQHPYSKSSDEVLNHKFTTEQREQEEKESFSTEIPTTLNSSPITVVEQTEIPELPVEVWDHIFTMAQWHNGTRGRGAPPPYISEVCAEIGKIYMTLTLISIKISSL